MKKYSPLYIAFSLFFLTQIGWSQGPEEASYDPSNIMIPPSPTASSIAKFAETPVGLYTGTANISVPLYQFQSKSLSIPISLNYHSGGHKVDEMSGWTGLGWSLSCNYVITRTIRGIADDRTNGYSSNPIMEDFDGGTLDVFEYPNQVTQMAKKELDGEPDLYHFSFPGGSGKFVFDQEGKAHVQPYQDIIIERPAIDTFIITSSDGTKYTFDVVEKSKSGATETATSESSCSQNEEISSFNNTGWYLSSIVAPNNMDQIDFTYQPNVLTYNSGFSATKYFNNLGYNGGLCVLAPSDNECISGLSVQGWYLESISSSSGLSVDFERSGGREDLIGGNQLDEIVIKNGTSTLRSFDLDYYYSVADGYTIIDDEGLKKRLKLKSVVEKPAFGSPKPPYVFHYEDERNNDLKLPPRLSYDQDHWGYYNNAGNNTFLPSRLFLETTYAGADRNTNENYVMADMLWKIDYPTGGHNIFEYEAHGWGGFGLFNLSTFSSNYVPGGGTTSAIQDTHGGDPVIDEASFYVPYGLYATIRLRGYNIDPALSWDGKMDFFDENGIDICGYNGVGNTIPCAPIGSSGTNWETFNNVYLHQGNYTIRSTSEIFGDRTDYEVIFEYHEIYEETEPNINAVDAIPVGGVRVKKQITSEADGATNDIVTQYSYNLHDNPDNPDRSSGILMTIPKYDFRHKMWPASNLPCAGDPCSFRGLSSSSKAALGTFQGSHIVYSNVTVYKGENKLDGKSEYTYSYHHDKGGIGTPYAPQTSYDWKRGLLLEQVDFKGSEGNYQEIQRVTNNYNFRSNDTLNSSRVIGLVVEYDTPGFACIPAPFINCNSSNVNQVYYGSCEGFGVFGYGTIFPPTGNGIFNNGCDTVGYHPCYGLPVDTQLNNSIFEHQFNYRSYSFLSHWFYLQSSTVIKDGVSTITSYEYDEGNGNHTQPLSTTITNSDDKVHKTIFQYPHDAPNEPYASTLIDKYMISSPLIITKEVDGILVGGKRIEMGSTSDKILPEKIYQKLSNGTERLRTTLTYYPTGYPASQSPYNGQDESYTWNNGRLTTRTLLNNWTWTYGWDEDIWQVETIADIDGQSVHYDYDGFQRLESTSVFGAVENGVSSLKSLTTIDYQIGGGNNSITNTTLFGDAPTQTSIQMFDGLGRLYSATLNGLSTESLTYNNLGQVEKKQYLPGSFTTLEYEHSPLNRSIKSIFPDGSDVETIYGSQGNYYALTSIDENDNQSVAQTDILGRNYRSIDAYDNITEYAYDKRDNIDNVLPPNYIETQEKYDYSYDLYNRLTTKIIPSGGTHQFKYNLKDQLVASKTGNEWIGTKYDIYGRPIQTGKLAAEPTDLENITFSELLTETFYDDPTLVANFPVQSTSSECSSNINITEGRVVGSKVRILDTDDWIYTTTCYDEFGRSILSNSTNHLDGNDSIISTLNLADLPTNVIRNHTTTFDNQIITETFTYDNFLRQLAHTHVLGDLGINTPKTLSYNIYNSIGQLELKHLGNTPGTSNYLQNINYKYNDRGWLTHINEILEGAKDIEIPTCDTIPPPCVKPCDYTVEFYFLPPRDWISDLTYGVLDPTTNSYNSVSADLNYTYYSYEMSDFQTDLIAWLQLENISHQGVTLTQDPATTIYTLTIAQSEVPFQSITTLLSGEIFFEQSNCEGGNTQFPSDDICDLCIERGYECDRCPFTELPDNCSLCTDMNFTDCSNCQPTIDRCTECANLGYDDCEKCPLTVKMIRPLSIKVEYNHGTIAGDGISTPMDITQNATLIRVTEKSQRILHDDQVIATQKILNAVVGQDSILKTPFTHVMELELTNQWVNQVTIDSVKSNIETLVIDELISVGISTLSIQQAFAGAVSSAAAKDWGGTTGVTPTPTAVPNPDLFSMQLTYGDVHKMINSPIQRNGNIAGMIWKTPGRNTQSYSFEYDKINRLTNGFHQEKLGVEEYSIDDKYGVAMTYDEVGNIQTLTRRGVIDNCPAPVDGYEFGDMDNLTYSYLTNPDQPYHATNNPKTNRLTRVDEAWNVDHGYKGDGGDYTYDGFGNMLTDGNKGISITYNHFNLPKSISFPGGNSITFTYDATGIKLKKEVSGSENYTLHYIGGIEYRKEGGDPEIESIFHAEGRVVFDKTNKEEIKAKYQFNLKDHLGNVRVVFSDLNENGYIEPYNLDPNGKQEPAGYTEIIQENHYYPFGMVMEGEWENIINDPENHYLYNGKELNSDFGLDWSDYGARYYDAAIGRFTTVDLMAEERDWLTVYNYVQNNPILRIDPTGGLDTIPTQHGSVYTSGRMVVGVCVDCVEGNIWYEPIVPLESAGIPLIPIPVTNATLIIGDALAIADAASDVAAPGKGLLKGGFKKLAKNLKGFFNKFAKKKRRKDAEHTSNARPSSEPKHEKGQSRKGKEQERADEAYGKTKSTKGKSKGKNQRKNEDPNYKRKGPKKKN